MQESDTLNLLLSLGSLKNIRFPPAKTAVAKYPYIEVFAGAFLVGFLAHPLRSRARTGVEGGCLIRQGPLFPSAL